MLGILLVAVLCYALAAAMVHLAYWMSKGKERTSKHYVLIAHNQHMKLEWLIRSFFSFSRRMGTDVKLTIVDDGSTDQTTEIVDRLGRGSNAVTVHTEGDSELEKDSGDMRYYEGEEHSGLLWRLQAQGIVTSSDQAVLVDLKNPDDLSKMPF